MMVRYQTYILEIFEAPIVTTNRLKNELAPRCLELSSDARDIWIKYHDGVEREMRRGGRFHELLDVAGKSAEQAARLAGVLAIVRDFKCVVIEAATMRQGCELASFYLNEARRIAEQVRIPPEIAGAQALLDWLRLRELKIVSATAFEKSGPRPLRFKGKLNPAIEVLEDAGWLIPVKDARRVWRVWQA